MKEAAILVMAVAASAASAQAGDAAAGQKVFAKCGICHAVGPGAVNKIGPQLNGVVGRKSATVTGYTYSTAMQNAKLTWDKPTLDRYLTAPRQVVVGTKMLFAGLPVAKDRADVIAYLAQYGPTGAPKK